MSNRETLTTIETILGRRFALLDRGWVELIDIMPHPSTGVTPDQAIVQAARVSYMGESKGDEKDRKLLHYLLRNRHDSPSEMVVFKMRLHAPVLVWWQLVRHRVASFNLQSGRYVQYPDDEFYVPVEWRGQSGSNKQASDGIIDDPELTDDLIKHYESSYQLYRTALGKGVSREMARLFLPAFGVYYTGIWLMNARSLIHFLQLRRGLDAQTEIRTVADCVYCDILKPSMTWTAEYFESEVE